MRKLIVLILGVSMLWGGYWYVGSSAVENGFRDWLEQDRQQGLETQFNGLATRGFPNRFDTTVTDIEIFDPVSGFGWSAPFFQVFALTYKPNHIIAVWPDRQTIQTPDDAILVTSNNLRASVVFEPGPSLTFERSTIEIQDLNLSASSGWDAGLKSGQFSVRQSVGRTNSYDLALDGGNLRIPQHFRELLGATSNLPETMQKLDLTTVLEFDRPWDRYATEGQSPIIQAVKVENFQAEWGDLGFLVEGEFTVDAQGIPTGQVNVTAKNWREMFQIAVRGGLIAPNVARTAESLLEILAAMSGDPETLQAPLSFQNGGMSFGPIPLGPSPVFIRR